jgi:hypothetical protein
MSRPDPRPSLRRRGLLRFTGRIPAIVMVRVLAFNL